MPSKRKPGETRGRHGTRQAEIERRKQMTFEFMLQGLRPYQIYELVRTNSELPPGHPERREDLAWNVSQDTIEYYHTWALQRLREIQLIDGRTAYRQSVMRYDELYRRCLEAKDYRGARQALESRDRLLRLDAFTHGDDDGTKPAQAEAAVIELEGGVMFALG